MIYQCYWCDEPRNFLSVAVHERPDAGPPEEYTLAHCESCGTVALFVREDMGDGFASDSFYRLWPPHDRHLGFLLPEIVRQSYDEAVKCEMAKAFSAAVVMVRRALEAVTKQYEPSARTLQAGLKAMLARGIVSQELSDWGHELRALGNLGAHASTERIERQDAVEAIDFLQATLEILYDLRPKFETMRARRAAATVARLPVTKGTASSLPTQEVGDAGA